jgi:hypothetical protein
MSKFTPGPWIYSGPSQHLGDPIGEIYVSQSNGAPYTSESSDVAHINMAAMSEATVLANARLIAAAPEMYELLKEVNGKVDRDFTGAYELDTSITDLLNRIDNG